MFDGDHLFKAAQDWLLEGISLPDILPPIQTSGDGYRTIMLLGAAESALVLHRHTQAFNILIHGAKRWFFYPPDKVPPGRYPIDISQARWLQEVYPK